VSAALDHLVLACDDLAEGVEYLTQLTGVAPQPGGKHPTMGTHNAVLKLGARTYLELIAIDPDAPTPARPRWFGLDDKALQATISERPHVIHWVASTHDIAADSARAPIPRGTIHAFTRGDFRWRLTVPDDGSLPGQGEAPTLIQWDSSTHPADRLPASHVALVQLAGSHPAPDSIRSDLKVLGLQDVLQVTYGAVPRLAAMLRTPRGLVSL
jgi:hypothetical protein